MGFDWQIKDCKCPVCKSEHRDLVNMDDTVRYTAHKVPRVVMLCDRCLCAKVGQGQMDVYKPIKDRLWKQAEERAGKSSGPRSAH